MVAYIIGFILVIIVLIILGLILRKRVYDEVDRLEVWKMDIMNRRVTTELQRVKALNLSGETQQKFETWKETWDRILTRDLPDIEEFLLDAEESADRFRMPSAKKNLLAVEKTLTGIELMIEEMYAELDDLLDSEKQSRKEVMEVQPKIKELRNLLLQNRHLYGNAEQRFEKEINEQQDLLEHFYSMIDEGNYYEARQIVNTLRDNLTVLFEKIEDFPIIYKKCKREVPDQIHQLLSGIKEMKEEGYRIEHHNLEKELTTYQKQLTEQVLVLEKKDVTDLHFLLQSIEERISEIYLLLEKEAQAKTYVEKHITYFETLIKEVVTDFDATNEEVTNLQQTYYLEESDLELYANLEKWIHQLERQYQQVNNAIEVDKETYVSLRDQIETSYQDLKKLQESHQEFKDQVRTIRKDEIEAKKSIRVLKRELFDTTRKIQKSNLPGIPSFVWNLLDEATERSDQVIEKLAKQPLDMGEVSHALKEAETAVRGVIEQTNGLIEQAYLVELVIQYSNRYRSKYPLLAAKLTEAENFFRDFAYEEALDTASQALEDVEPNALRRLESHMKVPS